MYNEKNANEIRIIPRTNQFERFVGIIICSSTYNYHRITIFRGKNTDTGYSLNELEIIILPSVFSNKRMSNEEKINLLISEAKNFATENEQIAICDDLAARLDFQK